MSDLESELTGYAKPNPPRGRQAFLKKIVRKLNDVPKDEFDCLSNAAVAWYNSAVLSMNAKQMVPDFVAVVAAAESETPNVFEEACVQAVCFYVQLACIIHRDEGNA